MHRFGRSEPRESALAYVRGPIAALLRKNGWTLAEKAGHAGPDRIQRTLNLIRPQRVSGIEPTRIHSHEVDTGRP
ncbi:hypothetical protein J2X68_007611 [Streptomyces sp. 3330]|nr:hypothetical protein [Streptomyces sp. 3330]